MNSIKEIVKDLINNTTGEDSSDQGVHDPLHMLGNILNGQETTEDQYLVSAIEFAVNEGIDITDFKVCSVWDNTINGDDQYISSFLIQFARKRAPYEDFWVEVSPEGVKRWTWKD